MDAQQEEFPANHIFSAYSFNKTSKLQSTMKEQRTIKYCTEQDNNMNL